MKDEFLLLYFKGCPNTEPARKLLAEAGVSCREVCQDALAPNDRLRGYSSPTLLRGSEVIFGAETGAAEGGCSLDIPPVDELKRRLKTG